jgi:hypothetical protein
MASEPGRISAELRADPVRHAQNPHVDYFAKRVAQECAHGDDDYKNLMDILWNFQPMPAGMNNYNRARHRKEVFNNADGSRFLGL